MIINSAADCISDPLAPRCSISERWDDEDEIEKVVWRNPINFFAQSGQISFEDFGDNSGIDRTLLHQGNRFYADRPRKRYRIEDSLLS